MKTQMEILELKETINKMKTSTERFNRKGDERFSKFKTRTIEITQSEQEKTDNG